MTESGEQEIGRRRLPRRPYECSVGLLRQGKYSHIQCHQIGEGGMMVSSPSVLREGDLVLTSFFLNAKLMVILRGIVRTNVSVSRPGEPERYGIEFLELGFHYKREIRNFVAAATHLHGYTAI